MELECYKIEVLHFLNPYLIWVEVPDVSNNADKFCFEQIGVFGVLPLEMSMDLVEDTLATKRSSDWMPAAAVLMKNLLADAIEVSFYPVHIDNRTTIFDDNIHKYGEIIVKKPNGKYRLLSKQLVKSGFAVYDDNVFQDELSSGKIKTKLSHNKIKDIIKHLEKKSKIQVEKQTKVFQTAQHIESTLTVKNLEAHNRRTKKKVDNFEDVLQRKLLDLQMCKDFEKESVGRATKKGSETSSLLDKKMKLLRVGQSPDAPDVVELFKKQRMDDLNALQKPANKETQYTEYDNEFVKDEEIRQSNVEFDVREIYPKAENPHTFDNNSKLSEQSNKVNPLKKLQNALKVKTVDVEGKPLADDRLKEENKNVNKISLTEVDAGERSFDSDNMNSFVPKKVKKPKTPNKSPKLPVYDVHKEARIAYGPPGTNLNDLPCKIVPKDSFVETYEPPEPKEEGKPKTEKEDMFSKEDSDAELEYTAVSTVQELGNQIPKTLHDRNPDIVVNNNGNFEVKSPKVLSPLKIDNVPKEVHDTSIDIAPITLKPQQSKPQLIPHENTSTSMLKRKLRHHKEILLKKVTTPDSSDTSAKDSSTSFDEDNHKKFDKKITSSEGLDSDDESVSEVIEKLNTEYQPFASPKKEDEVVHQAQAKNHVNPFKNVDTNISKFVEKLVTPVLMVHSKVGKRFQPIFNLRDVPFNTHIQIILKNMSIEQPMMLQTITWCSILRGYSTFIIGPKQSGKTMGYLPAVCRLVADQDSGIDSVGPMAIVVCATSNSVCNVEVHAKLFFGKKERVLAIYSGMNELDITTSLLNGCDLLICTPAILVRLLQTDLGIDLRRLTCFILDDCERLTEAFGNELKFFLLKIKHMLKTRIQKEVKVQYILASRVWCDFMEPLSKKAPDTVVCIGAFQECVLYSKAKTTVSFVTKENKLNSVIDFLKNIDHSKRTVIVCRTDEEVEELEKALSRDKYVVFACNSEMTVQNLYNLRGSWDDYQEPVIGPTLLCLDGNLTHLNVTDAHYLIHYSLPSLFSAFCKRFSVLNDNYPSIFKEDNEDVKIKIMLEDSNAEQLPKILHFIKRCTTEVPTVLDEICDEILIKKDKIKAEKFVPICDNLLTLGECPDFWNCQERHAVVKEFDEPQDWVPKEGMIAFKIVHYHSAVLYSARLLSHTNKGQTYKYPQKYSMLAMKISMYFSRESNRKLHGVPEIGDICAISIKQNFFLRCQVVKILKYYQNGKPNYVLVRLTDEEKLETTRDIYLYHLPAELTTTQTHVVHVRIANLQPKDKDITYSNLARDQLKNITEGEDDLYMTGQIALTVNNCVILESVEVCRDLSTLKKTVVLHDFKKILLDQHALRNEDHLQRLKKLCIEGGMEIPVENVPESNEISRLARKLPDPQWAHLENGDLSAVLFASVEDPSTFFVRLVKFEDSHSILIKDIQKYAAENTETLPNICKGDIVLAKLPDDDMFERARIDEIIDDEKVKCFFVDQGDWREVSKNNLIPITDKLVTQLPFQAIECRLVGVKPPGDNWTEFATNWFTNCFEDNAGNLKQIYLKYFTKEKSKHTDGHKYGVVLVDTNSEQDVIINDLIMEVNLAQEEESETHYLNDLDFKKEPVQMPIDSDTEDAEDSWEKVSKGSKTSSIDDFEQPRTSLNDVFLKKPIRSVPLIGSDESETSEDKWHINMTEDFMAMFKPDQKQTTDYPISNLPAIKNADSKSSSEVSACQKPCKNKFSQVHASSNSDSSSSVQKLSSHSDMQIVPSLNITELDSDDLTSPETSSLITKTIQNKDLLKEVTTTAKEAVQVIKATELKPEKDKFEAEPLRKPKVIWHQKKNNITIKILLITDEYRLKIEERELKFYAVANDTEYGFELQLYGIIDKKNATHCNKGQYIRIHLTKVMERNWLTLTRSSGIQKWIVYDVDSLEVESSDEDDNEISKNVIKGLCEEENNTDSEDEEFLDDVNFGYSR